MFCKFLVSPWFWLISLSSHKEKTNKTNDTFCFSKPFGNTEGYVNFVVAT